jgi:alpha-beta hydrolase superfamily lysophospholipase
VYLNGHLKTLYTCKPQNPKSMKSLEYKLKTAGGREIQIYEWQPSDELSICGIVQIAHGMAEHAGRYSEFARFLNVHGFAVYANDHRAHGKTAASPDKVGIFDEQEGFANMVADCKQLSRHIKEKHPDKALYVFGHSMGSFIMRQYITESDIKIEGAILSGTADSPGLLGVVGKIACKLILLFYPRKSRSPLMDKMLFGLYNGHFKPNRTKFDWLSRDIEQVDKYIHDPFCGGVFSIGFYDHLVRFVLPVCSLATIKKIPEDLSVLIFSGDKDPVGNFGKGVSMVYQKFKKEGVINLTLKLFENGRHEMLNETNRHEVYQFILDWLKKN